MSLMPKLHGMWRTVCPNNRKLNSNLFSPLNSFNRANGSKIRTFLSARRKVDYGEKEKKKKKKKRK